jgi:hypothetical protein
LPAKDARHSLGDGGPLASSRSYGWQNRLHLRGPVRRDTARRAVLIPPTRMHAPSMRVDAEDPGTCRIAEPLLRVLNATPDFIPELDLQSRGTVRA